MDLDKLIDKDPKKLIKILSRLDRKEFINVCSSSKKMSIFCKKIVD